MSLLTTQFEASPVVSQPTPPVALDLDELVITLNTLLEVHHAEGLSASQDRLYERLKILAKGRGCWVDGNKWWRLPKGGEQ